MDVTQFKNIHKGKRCWILGNGPSLSDIDLSLLKHEITFGTNRIYLANFTPTFYVCCNPLVLENFCEEIEKIETAKFVPATHADLFNCHFNAPVFELDTSERTPGFYSPEEAMFEGYTVTYVCLQLAYYMGFSEVILLGVDHDYGEGAKQGNPNQEVVGGDTGHFHPDYFKGVKWNLPDLRMSELSYSLAKEVYEKDGRKIFNASTRTKLDVFPLIDHWHSFTDYHPKVSAIVSAYKSEKYIKGLIEDLTNQTLFKKGELQILIVCQVDSPEAEFLFNQGPQKYIHILGTRDIPSIYEAWNIGIKAATGKYITNANTDDRHHPMAYELMARILDGRPDLDLVYHNCYVTWKPNQTFHEFTEENKENDLVVGRVKDKPGIYPWYDYNKETLTKGCYIGPQPMWRASLHQRFGYFDPTFKVAGDYDFWLRCAGEKNYFHIPYALGLYFASEKGAELSQPDVSVEEETRVFDNNQSGRFDLDRIGDLLRVQVGDRYTFVDKDQFMDMAEAIKYGGDPKIGE